MDDEKKYQSLKIENIVMAGSIASSLDIEYIADKLDGCVLNKKKFPGAVYHMKEPKMVALLFTSGRIILTGGKNIDDVKSAIDQLREKLDYIH